MEMYRNGEPGADAGCVLLWVQRSQRARANPAIELAEGLDSPIITVFAMTPGEPCEPMEIGDPLGGIAATARELHAAVVVTDLNPLRNGCAWREAVAETIEVLMVAVDGDVVVPSALFQKEEYEARTLRPKIQRVLDGYLQRIPGPIPPVPSEHRVGPDPMDVLDHSDLDQRVGSAPDLKIGTRVAWKRMRQFVRDRLGCYPEDRQRADIAGTIGLSPYLHFGQVSPLEIALEVQQSDAWNEAKGAFLDEFIGGHHDCPFDPKRKTFGLVRPMGMGAMKRTFDVNRYIAQIEECWD